MRNENLKMFMTVFAIGLLSVLILNCGGGSSGDDNNSNNVEQGVFLDAVVRGISYSTLTRSGETDEDGIFRYLDREVVNFSIGNLKLGSVTGKSYITPLDLVPGAVGVTDPTVTNLCKILQGIDLDGNVLNGITISTEIKGIVSASNLNFSQSISDFSQDQNTLDLFDSLNNANVFTGSTPRSLPSTEDAQEHLADTLADFPISLDYAYLQFRTFEDGSHSIKGWLNLSQNGNPIAESIITKIELKNENDDIIPISRTSYFLDPSYTGYFDPDTSSINYSGPFVDCGFSISFSGISTLPEGNYTYEVSTSDGDILTRTVYYPGDIALPCVDSSSMYYELLNDGSLYLTWNSPSGNNYDRLYVVFDDQDEDETWGSLLYIILPIDATEATIPSEPIQDIEDLDDPYMVHWVVQTRSYTDTSDKNTYARGHSDTVSFLWE